MTHGVVAEGMSTPPSPPGAATAGADEPGPSPPNVVMSLAKGFMDFIAQVLSPKPAAELCATKAASSQQEQFDFDQASVHAALYFLVYVHAMWSTRPPSDPAAEPLGPSPESMATDGERGQAVSMEWRALAAALPFGDPPYASLASPMRDLLWRISHAAFLGHNSTSELPPLGMIEGARRLQRALQKHAWASASVEARAQARANEYDRKAPLHGWSALKPLLSASAPGHGALPATTLVSWTHTDHTPSASRPYDTPLFPSTMLIPPLVIACAALPCLASRAGPCALDVINEGRPLVCFGLDAHECAPPCPPAHPSRLRQAVPITADATARTAAPPRRTATPRRHAAPPRPMPARSDARARAPSKSLDVDPQALPTEAIKNL